MWFWYIKKDFCEELSKLKYNEANSFHLEDKILEEILEMSTSKYEIGEIFVEDFGTKKTCVTGKQ